MAQDQTIIDQAKVIAQQDDLLMKSDGLIKQLLGTFPPENAQAMMTAFQRTGSIAYPKPEDTPAESTPQNAEELMIAGEGYTEG